jgi:hypothetical protein
MLTNLSHSLSAVKIPPHKIFLTKTSRYLNRVQKSPLSHETREGQLTDALLAINRLLVALHSLRSLSPTVNVLLPQDVIPKRTSQTLANNTFVSRSTMHGSS